MRTASTDRAVLPDTIAHSLWVSLVMLNNEWLADIHRRLIDRDPIASAELAEQVFPLLIDELSKRNTAISDSDLISDACSDALLNYVQAPESYDPVKRGLFGYLMMSAQGDLVNALDSLKRKAKSEKPEKVVELDAIPRNQLSELAESHEREEIERQIAEILPDKRDQEAALMMIDGERATERFAAVFGCEGTDTEVKKDVKRKKDRINKAIRRKLGGNDE